MKFDFQYNLLFRYLLFLQDKIFLRGFIFGLVHVGIMLIGYYTGWSINRLLKIVSNGFIAGIIGVVIAHVVADYIAGMTDGYASQRYNDILGSYY